MRSTQTTSAAPDQLHVPVQAKLAAAWTSFLFLHVHVDIIDFYKPGTIDDILVGVVLVFDITQAWAITVLTLMAVPILMVVLSATLPARASRVTNLVVASLQVPYAMFNVVGGSLDVLPPPRRRPGGDRAGRHPPVGLDLVRHGLAGDHRDDRGPRVRPAVARSPQRAVRAGAGPRGRIPNRGAGRMTRFVALAAR
jgi:hypothetical protein